MLEEPTTPPPRDAPKNPVVRVELDISFSAADDVLGSLAAEDRRLKVSGQSCHLTVKSNSPAEAIAEIKRFADMVRKATRKSERV